MINPYSAITNPEEHYNFFDYLKKIEFYHIFEPVFDVYGNDIDIAKGIVLYIAYAYSLDSPKITTTGDRRRELENIFKSCGLKKGNAEVDKILMEEVIFLQENAVAESARLWMDRQENELFCYLITLKEAYVAQQRGALSPLTEYDQKQKCIRHMNELRGLIKDATSELIQNNDKLKEAHAEIKIATTKKKSSGFGMEAAINSFSR